MKVNVLMDEPGGNDLEQWRVTAAQRTAGQHDYCLAFKADDFQLKVVARSAG